MGNKLFRVFVSMCLILQLSPMVAYATETDIIQDDGVQSSAQTFDDSTNEGDEKDNKSAIPENKGSDMTTTDGQATLTTNDEESAELTQLSKSKLATLNNVEPVVDAPIADDSATTTGEPATVADDSAGTISGVNVTSFKMKWVPNSSTNATVSEDGKTLTLNPTSNSAAKTCAMAQYEITLSGRQDDPLPAGSVVVRVPAHIFKGRDGEIIKTPVSKKVSGVSVTEPSGPEAPNTGNENAFNWTYDEDTDEIVYTNFREMTVHEGFTVRVQYQTSSVQVESGASVDVRDSSYSVKTDGGANALVGNTPGLSVSVKTEVPNPGASKKVVDKYESWQTDWGPAPENASDYYYVTWKMHASVSSSSTQPYSIIFDESKETNSKNSAEDGDIVAWTTGSTAGSANPEWVQEYDGKTGAEGMKADKVWTTSLDTPGNVGGYTDSYKYRTVVIKYPRSATENGATPKLQNQVTAIVEGVDGSKKQKVAFDSYTYSHVGFTYGGNLWDTQKNAWYNDTSYRSHTCDGGLSVLRSGNDYIGGSWSIYAMNQMAQTGSDGTILPADQQSDYGTVLRDGLLFIDGERLQPGDYEFTGFCVRQFVEYTAESDPNKGLIYTPTQNVDNFASYADDYHSVTVYTRDSFEGEWVKDGILTKTGDNQYEYKGVTYNGSTTSIPLPAGTCDVKFVHMGNQNKVELRFGLYDTLHPTEHVMGLIGEDTTRFDLYNIHDAWITDDQCTKISGGNVPNMNSTTGIKDAVIASDKTEYADDISYHDYSYHTYKSFNGITSFTKAMTLTNEDSNNGIEYIKVSMTYDDYFNFSGKGMTKDDAINLGVVKEQRECKFYDLLPKGCTVDLSSIRVAPYSGSIGGQFTNCDGVKVSCSDYDYTVEMVDNWRDSGQTMMIVSVKAPDGVRNYNNSSTYVDSGFRCEFTMLDSFENIATNGGNLQNSAAVVSQDGPLSRGFADDGGNLDNKDMFAGLNDAGGDLDGQKNVVYAKASTTVTPTIGSEFKFKKYVKSAEDAAYGTSTKVVPTGSYSYQLLVKNDSNNKQSGIILYDILENSYDEADGSENPYWKGELTGIDYSQATKLGADVKVYYSTATDWNGLNGRTDLGNTAVWSTTAPADFSTVTAVAFDCSAASSKADAAHNDGHGGFVLPPEENLACYLYLKAPSNYQDLMDNPDTTDVDETHKAYNTAFATSTRWNADDPVGGDGGSTSTTESNRTTVEEEGPSTELDKTSDPASGTVDKPAIVAAGDTLTYNLAVRNTNVAEAISDVTVVDDIPAGLTVDTSHIVYYSNNHADSTKSCDGSGLVKVEKKGQTLTFTINKVAARETIHLVIPTTVDVTANNGLTFDNQAKITRYNGHDWDIESDETHHASEPITVDVNAKKVWADNNNESGLRPTSVTVQLYSDGVKMQGTTATLNDGNGWSIKFSDLPKYKADGITEITYTVEEIAVDGYQPTYSTEQDGTLVVTNTAHRVDANKEAEFKIHKLRAGTNVVVPGVQYKLTSDREGTNQLATLTTDASGYATFDIAPQGDASYSVWLTEVSAPHGYTVDTTSVEVKLTRATDPEWSMQDGVQVATYPWSVTVESDGWNAGSSTLTRTNDYAADPVSLIIPVSKAITGNDTPADKTFSFSLTAETDGAPMPAGDGGTATVTGADQGAFGAITFTQPGTYKYAITEIDGAEPGYTYDTTVHEVEADVTDTNGVLSIVWKLDGAVADDATVVAFTNAYAPSAAKLAIPVSKKVTGATHTVMKDFTFQLAAVSADAPMPATDTVTLTEAGAAVVNGAFGEITYHAAGTYLYKVTELNTGEAGYTYDDSELTARVTVTDDNGTLNAKVEYGTLTMKGGNFIPDPDAGAGLFTNEYEPTPATLELPVRKNITGADRPADYLKTFEFTISASNDTPNAPLPDDATLEITDTGANHANGMFGAITFTEPGTYKYVVSETNAGETGYTYAAARNVTAVVTDNGGALEVAWSDDADTAASKVVFTNNYQPTAVSVQIPMKKDLLGEEPDGGWQESFTFKLAAKVVGEPMPATGGDEATVTGKGEVDFGAITYTQAGTYSYEVTEVKENKKGYVYDQAKHSVQVVVTDVDGTLQTSIVVDGQALATDGHINYANGYFPEAAVVELPVSKTITGNDRSDKWLKDFEFELIPAAGNEGLSGDDSGDYGNDAAPIGRSLKLTYTRPYETSIDDAGEAVLGDIPIGKIGADGKGELVYTVKEKAGSYPGYAYDNTEYTLKITSEHENGTYIATCKLFKGTDTTPFAEWKCNDSGLIEDSVDTKAGTASFTNVYTPTAATVQLPVSKSITGANRPEAKTFEFALAAVDGAPMPAAGGETTTVTGEGDGAFGEIEFGAAGTYNYTVSEVAGTDDGYTYDATVRNITVTVEDNDGKLEAIWADDVDDDATAAAFANSYMPNPTIFEIPVSKSIAGDARPVGNEKTFEFTLTALGGAPMPAGAGNVVTIEGAGVVEFGEISYTEAGTYQYMVAETMGGETGYTYDQETRVVEVVVEDFDGQLRAFLENDGDRVDDVPFTNTYAPSSTGLSLPVQKVIEGNERTALIQKNFEFALTADGDSPMPGEDGRTVIIRDEGTANFGEIGFDHAGTYHYTVTEADDGWEGYTYAEPRHVTVTVTDNDGVLEATWVDDAVTDASTVKFTNNYALAPAKVTLPVTKTVEGNERSDDFLKTFEFTLVGVDGAPMPEGAGNVVTIEDEGMASFGEITFTKAGAFTYTVSETNAGETGYTYADPHTVTVTVVDEGGWLKASVVVDPEQSGSSDTNANDDHGKLESGTPEEGQVDEDVPAVAFTNNYAPAPAKVTLPVTKTVEGNERSDYFLKTFEFTLVADDATPDAPMPEGDGSKVSVVDEGTATFGEITFTKAGTYNYVVSEVDGGEQGYTYASARMVTVTVVDNNGVLVATPSIAGASIESVEFTNGYAPNAAALAIPVRKTVTGDARTTEETFRFKIEAVDEAPLPKANEIEITGEGFAQFDGFEFTSAGIYAYRISEVEGTAEGYTFDTTVHELVVTVTDNDGVLEAKWTSDGSVVDSVDFVNKYVKPEEQNESTTSNSVFAKTGESLILPIVLVVLIGSGIALFVAVRKRRKDK